MATRLNPYLSFRDTAKPAMEFYNSVLGGTLTMQSFQDFGAADRYPGEGDKIMHAQLEVNETVVLMASDIPDAMDYEPGTNVSVSLSGDDEATLTAWYRGLAAGGTESMPLGKAPWGDTFGMLTDKFGINWLVNIAAAG
jgi:PhnB protein